mgnify:CR=1 FL=1
MRIFLLMLLTAFTLAGCTWYYLFSAAANELFQDEVEKLHNSSIWVKKIEL